MDKLLAKKWHNLGKDYAKRATIFDNLVNLEMCLKEEPTREVDEVDDVKERQLIECLMKKLIRLDKENAVKKEQLQKEQDAFSTAALADQHYDDVLFGLQLLAYNYGFCWARFPNCTPKHYGL